MFQSVEILFQILKISYVVTFLLKSKDTIRKFDDEYLIWEMFIVVMTTGQLEDTFLVFCVR